MSNNALPCFDDFRSNICEMLSASQSYQKSPPQLVAYRHRVYDASRGWGLCIRLYNAIRSIFRDKQVFIKEVFDTLYNTQLACARYAEETKAQLLLYQGFLSKPTTEQSADDRLIMLARRRITQWNNTFNALPIAELQARLHKLTRVYGVAIPSEKRQLRFYLGLGILSLDKSLASLADYQNVLDVEGSLFEAFPLEILEGLARAAPMSLAQEREAREWTAKVNRVGRSLPIGKFHKALGCLVTLINQKFDSSTSEGRPKASVGVLEGALAKYGCTLFSQEDPQHMKMRRGLEISKKITCNDREIHLEACLGLRKEQGDQFVVYTIEGDPTRVVVVGINPAAVGMEQVRSNAQDWGIPGVQWHEIDSQGRCAIVERLQRPLSGMQWSSTSRDLKTEELPLANGLAMAFKAMLNRLAMPENINSQQLLFDSSGNLKIIRAPLKNMELDFNLLVKLAKKFSSGNPYVLAYVLEHSGLSGNRYAEFYREVLKKAFKGEGDDVNIFAADSKISDPPVIKRANWLRKKALIMRDRCCVKLVENYVITMKKSELQQMVSQFIWSKYQKMRSVGSMTKNWEGSIIEDLVNSQEFQPKF